MLNMEGQAKKVAGVHDQPTDSAPMAPGLLEIALNLGPKAASRDAAGSCPWRRR